MKESIRFIATDDTPYFEFNFETGVMKLEGRSITNNPVNFYKPIYELLDYYVKQPASATTINIKLDYFTTVSAKCILDLFNKVEEIANSAIVMWHYETGDEDIKEAGVEFSEMVKVRFEFVEG